VKVAAVLSLLAFLALPAAGRCQTTNGEGTPIVPIASEEDYARVVKQAVEGYIVPAYKELAVATGELAPAVSDLCKSGERRVEANFDATIKAWAAVDFLRFGPMTRENRYDRFAFFPDVHGTGARQLRRFLAQEDENLLKPGALAAQSAAVQGLPALESLLYSGTKALLASEERGAYRCRLATEIAANLDRIAKETLTDWKAADGWAALIENPGAENPVYRTHEEAMTEILKAILTGLEQMRDHRLTPALGETPEEGKANRAPYNASEESLPYLTAAAEAIERFVGTSGILELLPDSQRSYGDSALFEFSNLKKALTDAGPDLEAALADREKRSKLVYATIVLKSLRDIFQRHIAVAAGLTPGFNSLDGD
jgi:predicted lipoprotein